MLNKIVLMGRLVSDPELKTTPSGISVTSFRIAVDRNYVKAGTERQTDFIDIVAWRQTAEFVCRYFVKGQLIALDGSLQTRSYQDKNGNNRWVAEVVADNIYFTGDRRESNHNSYNSGYTAPVPQEAPQQTPAAYTSGTADDFEEMPLDDDLPF